MDRATILEKLAVIHQNQARDKTKSISYDAELSQMGFDSLDISEIIMNVEEEFDFVIRMDDLIKLKTLNDFADYVLSKYC